MRTKFEVVRRVIYFFVDRSDCRLPQIQEELEKSIVSARGSLARLPREPSSDPRSEIAALLHTFTSDVELHVKGVSDAARPTSGKLIGLMQAIRPAQERFRVAIRSTAPKFRPFERAEAGKKHLRATAFLNIEDKVLPEGEISDDDNDDEYTWEQECVLPLTGKRKKCPSDIIYIDEVLESAHR